MPAFVPVWCNSWAVFTPPGKSDTITCSTDQMCIHLWKSDFCQSYLYLNPQLGIELSSSAPFVETISWLRRFYIKLITNKHCLQPRPAEINPVQSHKIHTAGKPTAVQVFTQLDNRLLLTGVSISECFYLIKEQRLLP